MLHMHIAMAPTPDALIKVLRTGRTHYDHTYTEGLNVCSQPWDDGDCTPGGFYACELRHIFEWITLYDDITEVAWVDVPADAQVARFDTKIKASKLVLSGFMPVEDAIRLALEAGANVHSSNDKALRSASEYGHIECVRLLLAGGADVDARSGDALFWSSYNGDAELSRILLAAGANVHFFDDKALRVASEYGHAEVVRLLLQAGADVHASNDEALRMACKYGYSEVVCLLLQEGADVHANNDYALFWAFENGHADCVRLLLKAGANVQALRWAPAPQLIRKCV